MKIFILALAALALLSGCAGRETGKTAEMSFGFSSEPSTLDPLSPGNTADGRSILFNVFEGLVKPDTQGVMKPCIAESWTIEQNAAVYNFMLRENVLFHDGTPVTPADVKFSLETAAAAGFGSLDRIGEILVQDNALRIILTESDPEFLPYLTVGIVQAGNEARERNVIGTGPFYIESYTPQRNLVLKKFDDYWDSGLPHLEKVTIVFFVNTEVMMLALRGGSIDGANVTGAMTVQFNNDDFDIVHRYSAAVQLLALNNNVPPLDDVLVRRAINYGIDVNEIIDTAFFGAGLPSGSPVIPGLSAYYNETLSYPYEPDTARKLLEEAAQSYLQRNGREPDFSIEITVPSNYVMHVDTAQVIVSQLERIGINANIKLVDWATWLSSVYFGRQYAATVISLDSSVVSPRSFLARYRSESGENFMNFTNTEFDNLYNAILSETDDSARINLYKEAQAAITHNAAGVYIQDIFYFMAFRKGAYAGFKNYPLYTIDFASIYTQDR